MTCAIQTTEPLSHNECTDLLITDAPELFRLETGIVLCASEDNQLTAVLFHASGIFTIPFHVQAPSPQADPASSGVLHICRRMLVGIVG